MTRARPADGMAAAVALVRSGEMSGDEEPWTKFVG